MHMKRIGVLTAGGDTPALNATIYGAVLRASQLRMEIFGFIKGFSSLLNPRLPHVHLNPLLQVIPELDATLGGTGLGASRDYLPGDDPALVDQILVRLDQLGVEGLICIGGDGTLNGLQPLTERLPVVLAPKTIDNDLGLNYPSEPDEWYRDDDDAYYRKESKLVFNQEHMVNYVTPGYATAVFDSAMGVERVRTTAESHRRIAIIEVMGRHSGYIALGSAYGRPDIVLVPECPVHIDPLVERIKDLYDLQKNVVIVCGEGIVDEEGNELGAAQQTTDPAGNIVLSGAAESLRAMLIERIGDDYFSSRRRGESASAAIFVRKVGHTQRGGRPVLFDRFYASQLGGKAVDMLQEGQNNAVAVLQWGREQGFYVDSVAGHRLRDRWGQIHARPMHASFYDEERMKPSQVGIDYLLPIFTSAIGHDDVEHIRHTLFDSGNLMLPYHSINTDVNKRIRYLQ
jgi:6-phosphofructokinase 1|tara:strand:- start:258 stop:1628 length:1371 start_codon:yes stop_codon:yes gene_type:complete